jgi:hypothetical protein
MQVNYTHPDDFIAPDDDVLVRNYGEDHGFGLYTSFPGKMIHKTNHGPLKEFSYYTTTMNGALTFAEVTHGHHWLTKKFDIYFHLVHPDNPGRDTIKQHCVFESNRNGEKTRFIPGLCAQYMKTLDPIGLDGCIKGSFDYNAGFYKYEWVRGNAKLFYEMKDMQIVTMRVEDMPDRDEELEDMLDDELDDEQQLEDGVSASCYSGCLLLVSNTSLFSSFLPRSHE